MKTKQNNKGFSLVELIVAFAIFAIVGIAICGFVVFSNKNFSNANKNLKLQYEQQVVVNRIRDVVVETSRGINFKETATTSELTILSDNPKFRLQKSDESDSEYAQFVADNPPYAVSRLTYDKADQKLYIVSENMGASVSNIAAITFSSSGGVLCDTIGTKGSKNPFKADLSKVDAGKITLDIIFMVGEKEVEVHPVIYLRNKIKSVDADEDLGELYNGIVEEHFSSVASVVIVRDGKKFSQGRTDTIAMAGDSTSVDYDAIVTKKSTVKDSIDTSVSWEIDLATIKDSYKLKADGTTPSDAYKMCITIDGASGLVTLKNATVKNELGDDVTITPNDVINGDYFIIKAISNQDPTKVARLRIKVTTGGVYPVSVKTSMAADYPVVDLVNEQATFKLIHSITYTDKIKDPTTGNMVNPLEGDGAYSMLHYDVYEDAELTKPASLLTGTGFVNINATDGRFIASKSMCGKTYYIANTLFQRDKDGQIVRDIYILTIPKDLIGEKVDATVPSLSCLEEHLRADYNPASANWSKGTPEYTVNVNGKDTLRKYEYKYEWTIIPMNEGVFTKWGNSSKNAFVNNSNGNVYFKQGGKGNDTFIRDSLNRIALIYCEPKLDWEGTFRYKIQLRVQLEGNGKSGYYKLPSRDDDGNLDYIAPTRDTAYVVEKVVVINPVTMTLVDAPSGTVFYHDADNSNKRVYNAYFGNDDLVHMGKKEIYSEWGNVWVPNAYGSGRPGYEWRETKKTRANPGEYYKIFVPEFTGIKVYDLNYREVLKLGENNSSPIRKAYSDGSSTLVPYYVSGNKYDYDNKNTSGFSTGLKVQYDKLYVYLCLRPFEWENTDKYPVGCKWTCIMEDNNNNTVRATFEATGADYINYTIHHAFEGECMTCKQ